MNVTPILTKVRAEKARHQASLACLERAETVLLSLNGKHRPKHVLSVAARKRIGDAQRKRWAAWKKQQ